MLQSAGTKWRKWCGLSGKLHLKSSRKECSQQSRWCFHRPARGPSHGQQSRWASEWKLIQQSRTSKECLAAWSGQGHRFQGQWATITWLRWLWWTCVNISVNCCENEMVTMASFGCNHSNTRLWDMSHFTTQQSAPLMMHSFFAAAWSLPDSVSEMAQCCWTQTPSILQVLWNSQDWQCHMAYVAPLRAKALYKILYIYKPYFRYLYIYIFLENFYFDTKLRLVHFRPPESMLLLKSEFCWSKFRAGILICRFAQQPFFLGLTRDREVFWTHVAHPKLSTTLNAGPLEFQTSWTSTQVKGLLDICLEFSDPRRPTWQWLELDMVQKKKFDTASSVSLPECSLWTHAGFRTEDQYVKAQAWNWFQLCRSHWPSGFSCC